jgi:single-strand DNA-binding protein
MYNKVILVGNLTRDVELKNLPSGSSVASFGLATNRRWKDGNSGEDRQDVMFIDITVFGRSAEIANQYLRKGSKVLVEGRLVLEQWTDQMGQKRSKHKIVADTVQFMESKAEAQSNNQYGNNGGYGNNNYNNGNSNQNYNNQQNNYISQQNNSMQQDPFNAPQQQSAKSQPAQTNNIPDIDVDNDDVPF